MKVSYKPQICLPRRAHPGEVKITLTLDEARQFLSSRVAVKVVQGAVADCLWWFKNVAC
jgi:hypothetical protein